MKRALWCLGCGIVALIAWLWWSSRPIAEASDPSASTSATLDVARAAERAADERQNAHESARSAADEGRAADATRRLRLELLRFPDEAPLDKVRVEIAPIVDASATSWHSTDSNGHLQVEVQSGATALALHATGYEPRELQLEPSPSELRVILTPASGCFGRVVDQQYAPIAGAEVRLELTSRTIQYTSRVTRSRSEVSVSERRSVPASATTNAGGFYFLAFVTPPRAERVRVLATKDDTAAALDVDLPVGALHVDDLVLSAQRQLTIRVVDENGAPVADATVSSPENPRQGDAMKTRSDGMVAWFAPTLPALFSASAPGMRQREQRYDEVAVPLGAKVESPDTRVELVLESVASVRVTVLDAETRQPIFLARGRVDFLRGGQGAGRADFRPDLRGEATVALVDQYGDPERENDGPRPFDVARLSASAKDYRQDAFVEIDLHAPLSTTPIELLLQPEPGTIVFRARVVRAGAPVAGLQMGVKVQRRSDGAQPRTWDYKRAWTDDEGRFIVRWPRRGEDQMVSAFPHRFRSDEFGFIGPLDVAVATASEQVLEMKPSTSVPAILRGVSKGGAYCYYVAIFEGDVQVGTTTNGAPIDVDTDGEARTMLLLPSDRRSRVSIGYMTSDVVIDNHERAIEFDPARPTTLEFDLQPFFASIAGRAVGFTPEETARLSVAFASSHDDGARTVRCNADGTFRINGVPRGTGNLLLLIEGLSPSQATALARLPMTLHDNVENLQLSRDPSSLPEAPSSDR